MGKRALTVIVLCLTTYLPSFAHSADEARKFDDLGNICCNEVKARLDNFAAHLLKEPSARGYIIFYEGRSYASCNDPRRRTPRRGEGESRGERMLIYLVERYSDISGIPVVLVDGGYREEWVAELWIVPSGSKPPKASPTLEAKDMRYRKGKFSERDYECMRNARWRAT
jgi:hypothetical protein